MKRNRSNVKTPSRRGFLRVGAALGGALTACPDAGGPDAGPSRLGAPLREYGTPSAHEKAARHMRTTKTPEMEQPDALVRRVEEAGRHMPLERLAVSPQCGFASTVGGNPVPLDTQIAKLTLVQEVARRVWG